MATYGDDASPDTSIARIRGTALLSLQAYLTAEHGAHAFRKVLELLPEDDRRSLEKILLPVEWYSTRTFIHALDLAQQQLGPHDFHERYGEFAANFEINRFFKLMLRFTNPGWLIDRGTRVWRDSHNTGSWHTEREENRLRGTLADFAVVSPTYCRVLVGWFRRASQLTGAAQVKVEHPRCRGLHAPTCVFVLEW